MLGKPRILSLFPTRLINSIKHEHSCKILYIFNARSTSAGEQKIDLQENHNLKSGRFAFLLSVYVNFNYIEDLT